MKEYLLFDLDGTLTDPKVGITTCVQYALKEFGIEEPDLDKLEPFIGPPLKDSFMQYYNFSEEDALKAIEKYRERFGEVGIYENDVYEGIPQMLRLLQSRGMFLAVASSKPTEYVERILEHFDLRRYFKVVVGSEMDGTRVNKDEVVLEALNRLFAYKPIKYEKVYMIGDRKFDVEGAKEIGVESIGVTYGYGSAEELQAAGADHIVNSVEELRLLLMKEAEALKAAREASQQGGAPTVQRKGFWAMVIPYAYPLLMFHLVRSVAGNFLMLFMQSLGQSVSGPFAELLFQYENGEVIALTSNTAAVCTALTYVIAAAFLFRHGKTGIIKTKEADKLKYLKAPSVRSYVLFGVMTVCTVLGMYALLEILGVTTNVAAYQAMMEGKYRVNIIIGILVMGIVIPLTEEFVFRGAIYNALKRLYKVKTALLISALLYGLISSDSLQGFYAFVIGYIAAYAYEFYGSFLAPVLIHIAAGIIGYLITSTSIVNTVLYSTPACMIFLLASAGTAYFLVKEKQVF